MDTHGDDKHFWPAGGQYDRAGQIGEIGNSRREFSRTCRGRLFEVFGFDRVTQVVAQLFAYVFKHHVVVLVH